MKHVRNPLHKWDSWETRGLSWEIKVGTWGSELYQAISVIVPQVDMNFGSDNKLYKVIKKSWSSTSYTMIFSHSLLFGLIWRV